MTKETSQLTKNDREQIAGIISGRNAICCACGVRVDSSRCSWRTCCMWDESFLCTICRRDGREWPDPSPLDWEENEE